MISSEPKEELEQVPHTLEQFKKTWSDRLGLPKAQTDPEPYFISVQCARRLVAWPIVLGLSAAFALAIAQEDTYSFHALLDRVFFEKDSLEHLFSNQDDT